MPRPYKRLRLSDHRSSLASPIVGDDGDNVLQGDPNAANEIWGYGGNDQLTGGRLDDRLIGGTGNDRLNGGGGADTLSGDEGDDVLNGGDGDDLLYGGPGKDVLRGGAGADTIFASAAEVSAADLWDGGADDDRIVLDGGGAAATIDLTKVRISGVEALSLAQDAAVAIRMTAVQLAGFERIALISSGGVAAHSLTLTSGGVVDTSALTELTLRTLTFSDKRTALDLTGTAATVDITINGGAGGDTIRLGANVARVSGGGGDDVIVGGTAFLNAQGGAGNDRLVGSTVVDLLFGGVGSDTIRGGGGNDVIDGGGNIGDEVSGPNDLDVVDGGAGDDLIWTYNAASTAGGDGNDFVTARFEAGTLLVDGGAGDDRLNVDLRGSAAPVFSVVGGDGFDTASVFRLGETNTAITDLTGATLDVERIIAGYVALSVAQVNAFKEIEIADLHVVGGGALDLTATRFLDGSGLLLSAAGNQVDLTGNTAEMIVIGDAGDDIVITGDAEAYVTTGDGDDIVITGNALGRDFFSAGDGVDWLDYSRAAAAVTVALNVTVEQDTGGAGLDLIYSFENLRGSAFGDTLTGWSGGSVLDGGAGDDTLLGLGAADQLIGGAGNDTLTGGAGDDVLTGSGGDDVLSGGTGADRLRGGAGDDTLQVDVSEIGSGDSWDGGDDRDRVLITTTGALDLTAVKIAAIEELALSTNADLAVRMTARQLGGFDTVALLPEQVASHALRVTLTTGGLVDLAGALNLDLTGLTLADQKTRLDLTGAAGTINRIDGGTADDVMLLGAGVAGAYGNGGNDTIRAGAGVATLYALGGVGDDLIVGGGGRDVLLGEAGSDTLRGGAGDDTLFGNDASASAAPGDYDTLDGGDGDDLLLVGSAARLLGSGGDDEIRGVAADGTYIDGGAGDDTVFLNSAGVASATLTLIGGDGWDHARVVGNGLETIDLTGSTFDVDELMLDASLLTIAQIEGLHALICSDLYVADGGVLDLSVLTITPVIGSAFVLYLSDNATTVTTGNGSFYHVVWGGAGDDTLIMGTASNGVEAGEGDDRIVIARTNGSRYNGNEGSDWLDFSTASAMTVDLSSNSARNSSGSAADTVYGFENLRGSAFGDILTGGWENEWVEGGNGADRIDGWYGDDILVGGAGADTLTGGFGADRFVFTAIADFGRSGTLDRITDFSRTEGDRIDLSAIDPDAGAAGDQQFTYVGAAAFSRSATTYELRATGSVATGFLVEGDINHDGVADFAFTVASTAALGKADFVL